MNFTLINAIIMSDRLYIYLKFEWEKNNLPKYKKYFDNWINNLTENQIYYYNTLWFK